MVPTAHPFAADDVVLLPHARPQHPRQVRGVLSQQTSVMVGEFVGNPAAACHASSLKQAAGLSKSEAAWACCPTADLPA